MLLGVEGAASARYFQYWGTLFDAKWQFSGRNRRPPRDPVNALLSLGYTLVCHTAARLAAQDGFETTLGFLHQPTSGRPSLALDLIEPLRPWVDEWILTQCQEGDWTQDDFSYEPDTGCRLNKTVNRRFFSRWHGAAEHWFQQLTSEYLRELRQALQLAAVS
jgi:CRISP-associated protein Cas1